MGSSGSNHNILINIEARNKAQSEINGVKQSLDGVDKATDNVAKGMGNAGKESSRFGSQSQSTMDKLKSGWNNTADSMVNYGNKHKVMTAGAVAGFADMAQKSSEYGTTLVAITKMSDDASLSGLAQADAVAVVSKSVDELSNSYKNMTKQDIANMFLDISRAGYGLEDAMKISDAGLKLATASGEDLESVTGILIRSMGAFGMEAKDAGEMARVLASSANASTSDVADMVPALNMVGATAHASGISFEETANAIAYMHSKGIQASTGARGLRTMLINMKDASNDGTDALKELGFEANENGLQFNSLQDMINKYQEATKNLTEEQKSQIAVQLGGKEAMASVLALMSEANVAYDEHGNKVESTVRDYEDFAKEVDAFTNDDLNDLKTSMEDANPWETFKAQTENARLALAQALAPSIVKVLDKLTEFATKLQDPEYAQHVAQIIEMGAKYLAFTQVVGTVGKTMQGLTTIFSVGSKAFGAMKTVAGLLSTGFGVLSTAVGGLAGVMTFLASPVGIITVAIGGLGAVVLSVWDTNKSFGENMKALWDTVVGFVKNPIETINSALQSMGEKIKGVADKMGKQWERIKNFFSFGSKSASDSTKKMSSDVDKNTSDAGNKAEQNAKKIDKGVSDGTKKASDSASKNTAKIKQDVNKNLSDASNDSMKQGQEIAKGLSKGMDDASKSVSTSLNKITTDINKGTTGWTKSFNTGFNGINNGARSNMKSVNQTVSSGMKSVNSTTERGGKNASRGFISGIRSMPSEARSIAYQTANVLRSTLGSINLYYQGSRVMGSFASGLRSQLSSVAMVASSASSLSRPSRSMFYDGSGVSYDGTDSEMVLSTVGTSPMGMVSNPVAISNKGFSITGDLNSNDNQSTPNVNITIHESFDGDKITRTVNKTNARTNVRVRTGKG